MKTQPEKYESSVKFETKANTPRTTCSAFFARSCSMKQKYRSNHILPVLSMLEIFVGCICTFCNLFPRKLYCKYLFCVLSSILKVYRCVYHRCRMRCCPSSVLQRCVRLRPCIRKARSRLPLQIREILAYISVLVQSLYFNSLTDSDVVFDSVFEPVFLTVDYVTRWFGTVSICSFI